MKGDARFDSMAYTPAQARASGAKKKRNARRTQPGTADDRPNTDLSLTTRRWDPATLTPRFAADNCNAT